MKKDTPILIKPKYIIESYSIGDYLLVSRLLNGDTISWDEAKEKLLSSRATNHATNVRKIINNFDCILNEHIDTIASYYERYTLNPKFRNEFQELKMIYESNSKFMDRFNKKIEKITNHNQNKKPTKKAYT
jgi:cell shape-determining protein MreC